MKKRNLKTLQLKKNCISKLYGGSGYANGGDVGNYDTRIDTGTIIPVHTQGAEPGCVWYSELYSACECHSIQNTNCIECPVNYDTRHDAGHQHA
ncbi:MAG: hypothetical protein AB8B65_14135 [Kordia sp.]|uniref:hypothetical protein n=1 Tax=Kordia sp. TaxID=1965332 RepID=UPI00385D7067